MLAFYVTISASVGAIVFAAGSFSIPAIAAWQMKKIENKTFRIYLFIDIIIAIMSFFNSFRSSATFQRFLDIYSISTWTAAGFGGAYGFITSMEHLDQMHPIHTRYHIANAILTTIRNTGVGVGYMTLCASAGAIIAATAPISVPLIMYKQSTSN